LVQEIILVILALGGDILAVLVGEGTNLNSMAHKWIGRNRLAHNRLAHNRLTDNRLALHRIV
jgi:hypothetical protein